MFADRSAHATSPARELALDCLTAGIEAARPERAVERQCAVRNGTFRVRGADYDLSAYEKMLVVGGGKAADGLAAALADRLDPDGGVVVTGARTADPDGVAVRLGEHPTPGEGSVAGAEAVLAAAEAAGEETLVVAAITGGGSALLCAPAGGLAADDLAAVTADLLAAGAPVEAVNRVRRACSSLKGGGLAAAAAPATIVGIVVSDVVGDDPGVVASGPTVPRPVDPEAALAVLDRYDVRAAAVREHLEAATPEPAPAVDAATHVVAGAADAIEAAAAVAADRGYEPCRLSTRIEGEASEAGRLHAAVAAEVAAAGHPVEPPAVLLSGGETTVTVDGDGAGGPNQEFAVGAGLALPSEAAVAAVDTDGRDGSTDAAGALVGGFDDATAQAVRAALAENDCHGFLEERDALLRSGPTGTNVNDLRVVVVD
ncbi:glycerate kinase [Halobacteriales archaeon QS_4_69_225]|nr:MAG: glycerate kinase [Halobacteriales archaeon QS_4_69_225]